LSPQGPFHSFQAGVTAGFAALPISATKTLVIGFDSCQHYSGAAL
jgi:hypothetical protein